MPPEVPAAVLRASMPGPETAPDLRATRPQDLHCPLRAAVRSSRDFVIDRQRIGTPRAARFSHYLPVLLIVADVVICLVDIRRENKKNRIAGILVLDGPH